MAIIRESGEPRRRRRPSAQKPLAKVSPDVVRQLFRYYSPTGRPQPPGLFRRAKVAISTIPKVVIDKLLDSGGKIVFVNEADVKERQSIPPQIQKLVGGMDLGILGDIANMYAPSASIDSKRPMVFVSSAPTGASVEKVTRHELGHSASHDLYLRRMMGLLYNGVSRKSPSMMPKTKSILKERKRQGEEFSGRWMPTLGHHDKTFPADKFPTPKRWPAFQTMPRKMVDEEKWAEAFMYYTDDRLRKKLHPDVQSYFSNVLGE